jgi:hypothetical protein
MGRLLARRWADSQTLVPTLVVGSLLFVITLFYLIWKIVRCNRPTALRGKVGWTLNTHLDLVIVATLLFLMGFTACAITTYQAAITDKLHTTLDRVHASNQRLVNAIETEMNVAVNSMSDLRRDASVAGLWAVAIHDAMLMENKISGGGISGMRHLELVANLSVVEQDATDAIAELQNINTGLMEALNTTFYSDLRDDARPVWNLATTLSHVAWSLISGGLTGLIAKTLYDYNTLVKVNRSPVPNAIRDPSQDQPHCTLWWFRMITNVLTWTSLFLLVGLALVLCFMASYTSVVCSNPYGFARGYTEEMDDLKLKGLSTYYLLCSTQPLVYYCENPNAVAIHQLSVVARDLAAALNQTQVSYTAYRDHVRVATGSPADEHPYFESAQDDFEAAVNAAQSAIYGLADCETTGPLFDRQITSVCQKQGVWVLVTAMCASTVVFVFYALATISTLVADAANESHKRTWDKAGDGAFTEQHVKLNQKFKGQRQRVVTPPNKIVANEPPRYSPGLAGQGTRASRASRA